MDVDDAAARMDVSYGGVCVEMRRSVGAGPPGVFRMFLPHADVPMLSKSYGAGGGMRRRGCAAAWSPKLSLRAGGSSSIRSHRDFARRRSPLDHLDGGAYFDRTVISSIALPSLQRSCCSSPSSC